jgi:hypothetical protein
MSMETIYKYPLRLLADEITLLLPSGAEVLSVGTQGSEIMIWARVHTNHVDEKRTFVVRGTGHPLTGQEGRFIGTVQQEPFVWHIFERKA